MYFSFQNNKSRCAQHSQHNQLNTPHEVDVCANNLRKPTTNAREKL